MVILQVIQLEVQRIVANAINASELADDAVDTDAIVDNGVTLGTKTSVTMLELYGTSGQIATSGNATGEGVAHTLSLENSGVTEIMVLVVQFHKLQLMQKVV